MMNPNQYQSSSASTPVADWSSFTTRDAPYRPPSPRAVAATGSRSRGVEAQPEQLLRYPARGGGVDLATATHGSEPTTSYSGGISVGGSVKALATEPVLASMQYSRGSDAAHFRAEDVGGHLKDAWSTVCVAASELSSQWRGEEQHLREGHPGFEGVTPGTVASEIGGSVSAVAGYLGSWARGLSSSFTRAAGSEANDEEDQSPDDDRARRGRRGGGSAKY
eukprot:PhM_4_TR115/c0_g1_i1/m.54409